MLDPAAVAWHAARERYDLVVIGGGSGGPQDRDRIAILQTRDGNRRAVR